MCLIYYSYYLFSSSASSSLLLLLLFWSQNISSSPFKCLLLDFIVHIQHIHTRRDLLFLASIDFSIYTFRLAFTLHVCLLYLYVTMNHTPCMLCVCVCWGIIPLDSLHVCNIVPNASCPPFGYSCHCEHIIPIHQQYCRNFFYPYWLTKEKTGICKTYIFNHL